MGFTAYTVQPKASATIGTGVGATLKKNKGSKAVLSFSISLPVAKQIGWSDGDKLEVMLGTDDHHGLIRLRKNNSAAGSAEVKKRGVDQKAYLSITMGHLPAYIDRAETKKWCQFDIVDANSWVEIRLPSWSLEKVSHSGAGTTSAPAPNKAGAVPATKAAGLIQSSTDVRRTSVTSSLMGDPPKNRSALAQRDQSPLRKPAPASDEPTRGQLREAAERREAPAYVEQEQARALRESNHVQIMSSLQGLFGATAQEAKLVFCLMDGRVHTKEQILDAMYDGSDDVPEIKIVDVFVSKARKKLATRLVKIETIWGTGYQMDKESAERVNALLQPEQMAG